MKEIYIVVSKTGTITSNFLNFFAPYKYMHASISLDKNLSNMYSFGRRYLNFALWGGFVPEDIEKKVFKKFKTRSTYLCISSMVWNRKILY